MILNIQPTLTANEYRYGRYQVIRVIDGYQVEKAGVILTKHRLLIDAMRDARRRNQWIDAVEA